MPNHELNNLNGSRNLLAEADAEAATEVPPLEVCSL